MTLYSNKCFKFEIQTQLSCEFYLVYNKISYIYSFIYFLHADASFLKNYMENVLSLEKNEKKKVMTTYIGMYKGIKPFV